MRATDENARDLAMLTEGPRRVEERGQRLYMPRIAGTTSVSATAPKSEKMRVSSMGGWSP